MQNDLHNKRLSKLGVASDDDDILVLREENERLRKLLDDKEKELQAIKKHFENLFENLINSRSAINPNITPNIDIGIVTYPTSDLVEITTPNGTGDYLLPGQGSSASDPEYPYPYSYTYYSNGEMNRLDINPNGSFISLNNNVFWENLCNVYKIDGEDSDSCDAASLAG